MIDAVKIFIQKHRDAFDRALPGAHGWPNLERMLDRLPKACALERQLMCDRVLLDTAEPSDMLWTKIERGLEDQTSKLGLETFIQKNREAFDTALPSGTAWENIHASLPKQKAVLVQMDWRRSMMRIAASLALVVAGVGAGIWYERQDSIPSGMAMSEVSGEYAELEQYYQRGISAKQEKLATFTGNQPVEVGEDLEHLDKIMEELRRELADVPPGNREQVVRAMIENYRAKTAILQRVLERLEESNTEGNNNTQRNEIKNI